MLLHLCTFKTTLLYDVLNVQRCKNIIKTKIKINKTHLENYLKHNFKIYN